MTKTLLFILLCISGRSLYAQSAKVTINNTTDFQIRVRVYGYAPSSYSSCGCAATYFDVAILSAWGFPGSTNTWGPTSACGVSTGVGFTSDPCSIPWCTSLPSDFQWTFAEVTLVGGNSCWPGVSFPMAFGDGTILCSPATNCVAGPYTSSTCTYSHLKATWTPNAGSAMDDITIDIAQY
jgi:hypothetical protein